MKLQIEYIPYRRRFRQPLRTAHGVWEERHGFLLRLTDADGKHGYGEVAPAPWIGSETVAEAERFLDRFSGKKEAKVGGEISRLPACRFALDAARDELRKDGPRVIPTRRVAVAALLPAGEVALEAIVQKITEGFRTFKWKIGVEAPEKEREIYLSLRKAAPEEARFRVDANGSLSVLETEKWLKLLDETGAEFLEQPMPPSEFEAMKKLQIKSLTPIALDESVADARDFENAHRLGWTGLYVIKPSIFGGMREGDALLPALRPRVIISSVFETSIGYESVLRWASRWQSESFAAGLGTAGALEEDGLFRHPRGPQILRGLITPEKIWETLKKTGE